MRHPSASIALTLSAAIAFAAASCLADGAPSAAAPSAAAPAAASDAAPQGYVWKHHDARVDVMGFTSAYTCDGIEGKVRDILRYLGARKNITVEAHGCPRGPDSLEHLLWLTVSFDTLVPAAADTAAADLVPAQWKSVKIDAQHPFFMGEGDCELIDALKPLVTANFSVRSFNYSTSCTPHQVTMIDFRVQGEVLKPDRGHEG